MRLGIILLSCLVLAGCQAPELPNASAPAATASPDGRIAITVSTQGALQYSVAVAGVPILKTSALGLKFSDGVQLGQDAELLHVTHRSVATHWENSLGKHRDILDQFNETRYELRDHARRFNLIVRAYNDGVAFRYELPRQSSWHDFLLEEEQTRFAFVDNDVCFAGANKGGGYGGPQEWNFKRQTLADLGTNTVTGLPLLVQTPAAWVAVTESDLRDWSGMWLKRVGASTLQASLAPRRGAPGLVESTTPHASPWRVLLIGATPGQLVESDLVLNLAAPSQRGDFSWVKPGMMAWDHWWAGDTKMTTATLKDYIQLAADMGWPYQMIDWHWYGPPDTNTADITRPDPAVDMPEVLRFARERGVREWVWLNWHDVDRHDAYKTAFPIYEKWGVAGVKIDFMDRDDQDMVNWYEKIARAGAAHHLMVDFHGAYKPTGLSRTYPNQITREGVLGNEYNKWSNLATPEHKLTLPFTRFLAGPGDFTPGGFRNRQPTNFSVISTNTEVQGTRAAELALFVTLDSPIGCACDSPEHYRGQPGVDFLKIVPTVWDETRVLDGVVGEHLAIVRRHGKDWFLGAMTDATGRALPVSLNFLGNGAWKMRLWKDGPRAATDAEDLDTEERTVTAADTVTLSLAPNGGAAAVFRAAP
ncbi:MAG TPA: glycoside hydrolase family 97 protein [Verrucomicrobiae bacterium]|jgi:alpha-glucosidase|nr:glycoside hydrolase family 97 protein [Verrucomicrobiae bacterium]